MNPPDDLGRDSLQEDGHLTDLALTAAADGEDLLSEAADAHLVTCEACTARLVSLARTSIEAREVLELARPLPAPPPVASVPWGAFVAAFVVSVGALSPRLSHLPALVLRVASALLYGGPVLLRGVVVTLSSRGPTMAAATLASSSLLIFVGVTVSRVFHRPGAPS